MTREQLREGWVRAWSRFYSCGVDVAALRRCRRRSSWIQRVGFWPLNVMQHRLSRGRIAAAGDRARQLGRDAGPRPLAPLTC